MANEPQNSPFIKQLASSDKRVRDSALESLRTYLSSQSSISSLDLLKLWKGLYYCMWMQDKPLHQQRLSRDLASLVNVLRPDVVFPFIDAFWKTMAREWGNIGSLRMDKYLYLVRCYIGAAWKWLDSKNWSDEKVEQYTGILSETPLNPTDAKIPNGMRYHVLDIYLDELEKVRSESWDVAVLGKVIRPVSELRAEGRDKSIRSAAKEVLDDDRLKVWRGEIEATPEETQPDDDDEWGGIED